MSDLTDAVLMVNVDGGEKCVGFVIENGNTSELKKYDLYDMIKDKKEIDSVAHAEKLMCVAKAEITALGYTTGPIITKTHKEWSVEVFDVNPADYDRQQAEGIAEQAEFDEQ